MDLKEILQEMIPEELVNTEEIKSLKKKRVEFE